jgi:hypothetical protein
MRERKIQTKSSSITVCRNMSNDVYNQSLGSFYNKASIIFQPDNSIFITEESLGCFYHKSSMIFQPDNSFVFRNEKERSSCSRPRVTKLKAFSQTTGSNSSYSLPLYSRSLKQRSKDCWHLVETLGSAIWPHRRSILDMQSLEKLQTSDFPLPGWIFLRFSPVISVLLYSQALF